MTIFHGRRAFLCVAILGAVLCLSRSAMAADDTKRAQEVASLVPLSPDDDGSAGPRHSGAESKRPDIKCGNGMKEEGEECDDGNLRNGDGCDSNCKLEDNGKAKVGCVKDSDCPNTNACVKESCMSGTCQETPLPLPDDGNPCTKAVCDPMQGMEQIPQDMPYDDGDPCTTGEGCQGGVLQPGQPVTCNDNNPCTVDSCVPKVGCVYDGTKAAGQSCPLVGAGPCDVPVCNGAGRCVAGAKSNCCDPAKGPCAPEKCTGSISPSSLSLAPGGSGQINASGKCGSEQVTDFGTSSACSFATISSSLTVTCEKASSQTCSFTIKSTKHPELTGNVSVTCKCSDFSGCSKGEEKCGDEGEGDYDPVTCACLPGKCKKVV